MLGSMRNLHNDAIHATDGNMGHVVNFYFERYLGYPLLCCRHGRLAYDSQQGVVLPDCY